MKIWVLTHISCGIMADQTVFTSASTAEEAYNDLYEDVYGETPSDDGPEDNGEDTICLEVFDLPANVYLIMSRTDRAMSIRATLDKDTANLIVGEAQDDARNNYNAYGEYTYVTRAEVQLEQADDNN